MRPTQSAKHLGHSDARLVLTKPMLVTAGGVNSSAPLQAARLVMAGNPRPVIEGLPGYSPIIIKVDWPDMSTPAMSSQDWKWLAGRIRALKRPLHVSCAMGHGRTGTCLVLLAHFWRQIPADTDPVTWIRSVYCAEAIETASQIAYIERMTGLKTKCKAKEPFYTVGGHTYANGGDFGAPYGWTKPAPSEKPSSYFPENNASKYADEAEARRRGEGAALATGKYSALVRYCGQTTKGVLCPKPAAEGLTLCDKHYMEAYPEPAPNENGTWNTVTDSGDSKRTGPTTWSDPMEGA